MAQPGKNYFDVLADEEGEVDVLELASRTASKTASSFKEKVEKPQQQHKDSKNDNNTSDPWPWNHDVPVTRIVLPEDMARRERLPVEEARRRENKADSVVYEKANKTRPKKKLRTKPKPLPEPKKPGSLLRGLVWLLGVGLALRSIVVMLFHYALS